MQKERCGLDWKDIVKARYHYVLFKYPRNVNSFLHYLEFQGFKWTMQAVFPYFPYLKTFLKYKNGTFPVPREGDFHPHIVFWNRTPGDHSSNLVIFSTRCKRLQERVPLALFRVPCCKSVPQPKVHNVSQSTQLLSDIYDIPCPRSNSRWQKKFCYPIFFFFQYI